MELQLEEKPLNENCQYRLVTNSLFSIDHVFTEKWRNKLWTQFQFESLFKGLLGVYSGKISQEVTYGRRDIIQFEIMLNVKFLSCTTIRLRPSQFHWISCILKTIGRTSKLYLSSYIWQRFWQLTSKYSES